MVLRVHIDTDCGVDDALALTLLARARQAVEVVSVSAVFGNTYVDQAAANARGVLRLAGCGAEVYIGAGAGLAKRRVERMRPAHGVDGLNGVGFSQRWKLPELERGHSANFLAFAARRKVTGLFLGPLTNLAKSLLEDPAAFRDWRPTVMAGAFTVEGKAAGGADFNSWSDPEALQRVLEAGIMPRLVPLDVSHQVAVTADDLSNGAVCCGSPLSQRLTKAAGPYIAFHQQVWGGDGCRPHDAVAAASLVAPELFTFEPARLRVAVDGEHLGRVERVDGAPNAEVCTGLDVAAVKRLILGGLFGWRAVEAA
ncbi:MULTISPECIES: nucleoside hydrolase [unclassified Caulobacter]|uniref:nucleoside hydrolase n=1 Tax=unclassified Caulobacter TaxID=2648921 RepID=UPI0006FC8D39|nr:MULTISPECIES: nucleoside hydrolase [unclassified Caulobacter]KQV62802.1 nucleoside hydrolase [Caulobacter sp. Root342]KQV71935.1 nucleoside hydrolase [Caulobacter sp. Root343]